ncbi:hypothetical protein AB0395_47800 [Streptosporangium sp. NPDC051023]|uniref:hypothetical protein n=1 Tax=Streptosporangium sp. NPDC051023 TaxID=3155410 RepID=UPI00344F858E
MADLTDSSHTRVYWIPKLNDPDSPTPEELAAGVFLGGEVVDDGLQLTRVDTVDCSRMLPPPRRYKVIHNADGSVDVIPEDPSTLVLVSEPNRLDEQDH